MLKHFHARIEEKNKNMGAAPVVIVALGDSVTHGLMQIDELDQEGVYHHQLWKKLIKRYPGCVFSVINAGVGGDSAPGGLARLERDVLRHQPDLVLVAYALNDSGGGEANLPNFSHALSEIIGRTRRDTKADAILLTPNFMCTRDNPMVADAHRKGNYGPIFAERQNSGGLAVYAQAVREVGARLHVPIADVYAEWQNLASKGVDTTAMLSNGLNHPDVPGHKIAADAVMRIIEAE